MDKQNNTNIIKKIVGYLNKNQQKINKFKKIEYLYAIIAATFGLIFLLLIPAGWNADEPQHYWRAQQIAHGQFVPQKVSESGTAGGTLPSNSADFILSYGGYVAIQDYTFRLNFPSWVNDNVSVTDKDGGALTTIEFTGSSRYSPVVYAPQSVGLFLANKLGGTLLQGFVLAKLFGLAIQIICFFFAIRWIPRGKWAVFAIGLLPSTVVQSVAFGGDVMTTSACILFISLLLKACFDEQKLDKKTIIAIFVLMGTIGLVKPSYIPLAGLIILIPILKKAYRNKKSIFKLLGFSVLAIIPSFIWTILTSFVRDNYGRMVSPNLQIKYIIHEPIQFILTTVQTYFTDDQPKVLKTLFGNFVWDTAPMPLMFMFIGVLVLTLVIFLSSNREKTKIIKFNNTCKIIFIGMFLLLVMLISAALYIFYTPYKATSIEGLQARYYIPFLILPILAFLNPLPYKRQKPIKYILIGLLLSMLVTAVIIIIHRIYI